jgi:hypothetical protein
VNLLFLKAKIYQYTGLYLAYKEQCEFLESEEFWSEMERIYPQMEDMSLKNIQGMLIGMWQGKHKFYRRMDIQYFSSNNVFLRVYSWFRVFYWTLKADLERLYK